MGANLPAATGAPVLGDISEYLVDRFLATHRERFLATREDKRHVLLSLVDLLAPTPIVAATGPQIRAWLGDDGAGTFEFACVHAFFSWCVGEGLRAENPVAEMWPARSAALVRVAPPPERAEPPRPAWSAEQVDRFYADLLEALGELARAGGTAVGAGAVAKRVGKANGIAAADRLPVPRLTRAEADDLAWLQRSVAPNAIAERAGGTTGA